MFTNITIFNEDLILFIDIVHSFFNINSFGWFVHFFPSRSLRKNYCNLMYQLYFSYLFHLTAYL